MKISNLFMTVIMISSSVTACSSSDNCHTGNCDKFYKDYKLGGAAVRQEGYVHVLAVEGCCEGKPPIQSDRNDKYLNQNIGGYNLDYADLISVLREWDSSRCAGSEHNRKIAAGISDNSLKIINSDIDLGRWERYCNKGKHMNENDWNFVKKNNYHVPEKFEPYCIRPDFTYDEYINAWESFCNADNKTSKKYMKIVKETVRPQKLIRHCKLLNNFERTYKK